MSVFLHPLWCNLKPVLHKRMLKRMRLAPIIMYSRGLSSISQILIEKTSDQSKENKGLIFEISNSQWHLSHSSIQNTLVQISILYVTINTIIFGAGKGQKSDQKHRGKEREEKIQIADDYIRHISYRNIFLKITAILIHNRSSCHFENSWF